MTGAATGVVLGAAFGAAFGALVGALAFFPPPASADEPAQPVLPPPGDLAPEESRSVRYREHRVGGRLERVIITRENGVTELYRNNRADTIWAAQENELGEVPNMRQWIIRTW